MSPPEIQQRIIDRSARLAVIGLGYVGLPVACAFAQVGFDVIGIDVINKRIEQINHDISPIPPNEPELADLLASVIRTGRLHNNRLPISCRSGYHPGRC
jgi:UDP-N-acetyl-D-mannosaminuronic acid dehydrogenase